MNLYEFMDNWLQSSDCIFNYKTRFVTKDEVAKNMSSFSDNCLKKQLHPKTIQQLLPICRKYLVEKSMGHANSFEDFFATFGNQLPERDWLRNFDAGMAAWEGYPVSASDEAALKEMVLEGVRIISEEEADQIYSSHSRNAYGHYESVSRYSLEICAEEGKPLAFVAIDNSSGDAFTEEFKTLEGARAWLNGVSVEEVEETVPGEKPEKSLQELCDEPIVGEINIGGVRIVVDPKLTDVTYNEAVNYIEHIERQRTSKTDRLTEVFVNAYEGDNVALDWTWKPIEFERIRRITGYLVGDLNRWNDAKKKEERDRVKHTNASGR